MGCADLHSIVLFSVFVYSFTHHVTHNSSMVIYVPTYLCVCFVCLFIHLSIHPSVRPSVCLSVCLSVHPSFHLSVCLLLLTHVRYRLIEVETSTSKITDRGCKGNLFTVLLAVVILRCYLSRNFSALKNQ
jgi:hypothetical protein